MAVVFVKGLCVGFVIFMLVNGVIAEKCEKCPNDCDCHINISNHLCHINCSSVGLQRVPLLQELSEDTYHLDLSHNEIQILPRTFLNGLTHLKVLNLHNNSLSLLTREVVHSLTYLQYLYLSKNIWNCNCDLKWLQLWVVENKNKVPDLNSIFCFYPNELNGTRLSSANLSEKDCADDFISCAWNNKHGRRQFILWDYKKSNITSEINCTKTCFSKGYFFAHASTQNSSCLCALENSADFLLHNHTQWLMCSEACSNISLPTVCGRKIVHGVVRASPELQFTGLRAYSQQEEVVIVALPKRPIAVNYLWSFNDSTPTVLTKQLEVHHKYAVAGRYCVTVTAQNGIGLETYSMLVTVQNLVQKLELTCPSEAYILTTPSVVLNITSGNSLFLHWDTNTSIPHIVGKQRCFVSSISPFLCYQLFMIKSNWTNAQLTCQQDQGDLIVVDSPVVQSDIENILIESEGFFWIGLNSYFLKGTFLHVNGYGLLDSGFKNPNFNYTTTASSLNPPKDCVSVSEHGKWVSFECRQKLGFICQYQVAEKVRNPKNFLAGTAQFQSNYANVVTAPEIKNYSQHGIKNFTILFPGLWLPDDGILVSWEVVAKGSLSPLRLLIYKPLCPPGQFLNSPGCAESPYATCSESPCTQSNDEECTPGVSQFCYFNKSQQHCRNLDSPCNWYVEYGINEPARHRLGIPNYSLVAIHVIAVNQSGTNLYQSLMNNGISVEKNDIIGIGFSSTKLNQISDIPLVCTNSSLSSWRQSAMLFSINDYAKLNHMEHTYDWMDFVWCDVRLHLSQTLSKTEFAFDIFNMTKPGSYKYAATVANSAMNKFPTLSSHCVIKYIENQLLIDVASPASIVMTSKKHFLYVEQGKHILFEARLAGQHHKCPIWTVKTADESMKQNVLNCSGECCLNASLLFTHWGKSHIQVQAEQQGHADFLDIEVITEERIGGVQIIPQGIHRILVGIPKIFRSSWINGTNVTTTWVIDELNQYGLSDQMFTVLFRKPGTYKLTMILSNHVSAFNISNSLIADKMYKLANLQFVNVPAIALFASNVTIKISVLVDEDINAVVLWYIGTIVQRRSSFSPPYKFPKYLYTRQILLEDELQLSPLSATVQNLKVVVRNDYDSVMNETMLDVRNPLNRLFAHTYSRDLVAGIVKLDVLFSPHYETLFAVDWKDGSKQTEKIESQEFSLQHNYSVTGIFNISIFANNTVSTLWNFTTVVIHEKLSGLELLADNMTEVNVTYFANVSMNTPEETVMLILDFGDNSTFSSHTKFLNTSHVYTRSGHFNITATAQNPASVLSTSMEINVYAVEIKEVLMEQECYGTDHNFSITVVMAISRYDFFSFAWNLLGKTFHLDNNLLVYSHSSAGIYLGEVTAHSLQSSQLDSKEFVLCIQEPIESAVLYTESSYILSGSSISFAYKVLGGTNATASIVWGDNSSQVLSNNTGNVSHIFEIPGTYVILLNATNAVSHRSSNVQIHVLDIVRNLTVATSSLYGTAIAKGHNVTYTASYSGSAVSVLWKFGDMSEDKHGNKVSHVYFNVDDFFITVKASNALSEQSTRLKIVVQSPVEGVIVSKIPGIVFEDTTTWFNITEKGNAKTFCWKVSPSLSESWGPKLEVLYYSYVFTMPGEYMIFLMAENEVSSQNFSFHLSVVANISSLNIVSNDTKDGYGPVNEIVRFVGVIFNNGISSPVPKNKCSSIFWRITDASNNRMFNKETNASVLEVNFNRTGVYEIWLNVTNCLEKRATSMNFSMIERIFNVTLSKKRPPFNAASIGEEVIIEASISEGTELQYAWKPHVKFYSSVSNNKTFTHIYLVPSVYTVCLELSNPLDKVVSTFTLHVQESIKGLQVEHLESVVPFYVAFGRNSLFHASVLNGSSVIYAWQFIDIRTNAKSDWKCTVHNTINWNFTEITTYLLMLNASNSVSWDFLNTTVHVISPLVNLEIHVKFKIISIGQSIDVYASAYSSGNDIIFNFDMGDGLPTSLGTHLNSTTARVQYSYSFGGNYTILVTAANNATVLTDKVDIFVREAIVGLKVIGVGQSSFIAVNISYNLFALVDVGTDVTFIWYIQYPHGISRSYGSNYELIVHSSGTVNITVVADNIISQSRQEIVVMAQIPPDVDISLKNGDKIYVNEVVGLNIIVHAGTNLRHFIDFGDGNTLNTSQTFAQHVYHTPADYVITVLSFNSASKLLKKIGVTILKLVCARPKLAFVGSNINQSKFYRSRNIYIETEIETFGCNEYIVKYVWKMYQQVDCDHLNDSTIVKLPFARTPLLVLGPLTLNIGHYCVVCTASFIGTPLEHTVKTQIEIISTPLAVIITGGTFRSVSQSSKLVLDASSSFDPDLANTQQTEIQYNWTCSAFSTSSSDIGSVLPKGEDNCFEIMHGETIQFDGMNFVSGLQYNFTVTAFKADKMPVSTWQSINFVQNIIPTVTVTCVSCQHQSSLQISFAHHLTLLGSCDSCTKTDEVYYSWEAFCKNNSSKRPLKFPLNTVTTTTGSTGRYLVVRVGAMKSCYEYEFELSIRVNNYSGISKLVLYANKPPGNGNCTFSFQGEHIYVLETLVRFQCFGWVDEDISLLVYTILAIRYVSGSVVDEFIIYRGTASEYEAYLPLGLKDNNFDVTLQIVVEDELGTYSIGLNRSIVVELSPETQVDTIQWLRNKTFGQLAELGKSSNPQWVVDFAAGLITVLNQNSDLQSATAEDTTFESRKEIRNNITRTVTSLVAQTLDEIKQVTTVFKQCVKIPSELQDSDLQNVSIRKLIELAEKMPEYIDTASQTTFITVTENLMDIASYMVDSVNYVVYREDRLGHQDSIPSDEEYRKDMVELLMSSAVQLTSNVLDGKVEGEEPFFLNATALSSVGARTTVSSMNRSVHNDGCFFDFPSQLFCGVSDDLEILYILVVMEQNPYTFGHTKNHLASSGLTNISTRVPVFEFKTTDHVKLELCSENEYVPPLLSSNLIRIVMASSDRTFITSEDTGEIAAVHESSSYYPRQGLVFENFTMKGRQSIGLVINNNNTDEATAVYIMVVYDFVADQTEYEQEPYVDVLFHPSFVPNVSNYINYMRLRRETVLPQADHRNYTIFIKSGEGNTDKQFFLNVTSYYKYSDTVLQVGVYYCACQFYDTVTSKWSSQGITTSHETTPSAAVCYSSHLTSFGSFVLNPPNLVDITEIKNINFAQNPVALVVVIVVFSLYMMGAVWCRFLDVKDLEKANGVPLCGANGQYKFEISIKTSPGIGSGTTANVGIIVYGYKARSESKHLFKQGAFQRGCVDVFQIACDIDLGVIYKIKLWHDNTGLDPAWNVSRLMIKDLQNGECYFFLADTWLQVYPHDTDDHCLIKTLRVASDEEMSDFSLRFGNHVSYGWEDVHLWISLIERPARSNFSRVQRLTCCVTLLYSFMVLCAFWYQNYDDETFQLFRWQDIAVGIIVTIMVFPINMIIVFCFKNTRCKVDTVKQWPNRAQTAQTVEILNEILEGNADHNLHSKSTYLPHSRPTLPFVDVDQLSETQSQDKKQWISEENFKSNEHDVDSRILSDDTGISSAEEIPTPDILLSSSSLHDTVSKEDNFWDSLFIEDFSTKQEQKSLRTMTLKRTHRTIYDCNTNMLSAQNNSNEDMEPQYVTGDDVEKVQKTYMLPHQFVYFAYFLCYSTIAVSIFFVILYGHQFGGEKAIRWLASMLVSLGGSIFLIEPIKVILLAVYISLFTNQQVPECENQKAENPLIENYEHVQKRNKIWPPGGYALEQCKEQAKKSKKATKLIKYLVLNSLLLSSLLCFVFVQRVPNSYWDVWSIKTMLHQTYSSISESHPYHTITFDDIRTINDIWMWTSKVFVPTTLSNEGEIHSHFTLLGKVRICQQRYIPGNCITKKLQETAVSIVDKPCISNLNLDKSSYAAKWKKHNMSTNSPWSFSNSVSSIRFWGMHEVYDDSGYCTFLDIHNATAQLQKLKAENWLDNLTSLYFLEFTHFSWTSLGSVISLILFEIDETGVVCPSYSGNSIRLFSPEFVTMDMVFMVMFGSVLVVYWCCEIYNLFNSKQYTWTCVQKVFKELIVLIPSTLCSSLFVYKLILLKQSMTKYKKHPEEFSSFNNVACISEILTITSAFLLTLLCLRVVKLFKYVKKFSTCGKMLNNCLHLILGSCFMFSTLVLFYAQLGYLVFGLNSGQTINAFGSFWKSLSSMLYIICRGSKVKICFDARPMFAIVFFYSYFFCAFIFVGRICSAVITDWHKHDKSPYQSSAQKYFEIFDYIINRIKLRFGIIKPKQYRHRVHFEGMSTPSLRGSLNSLDSFGTCFTPGRVSQCSYPSDLSITSSDSGLGTPSDHSLSLFDYLTLENPPLERPMDSIHLHSIYNRVSTYSVDMLLHRFDRVNKLADDLLTIEIKLLEIFQGNKQQQLLQEQAKSIAKAASTVTSKNPSCGSLEERIQDGLQCPIIPEELGIDMNKSHLLPNTSFSAKSSLPSRSSSYIDFLMSSDNKSQAPKKRPYSDEGMRPTAQATEFLLQTNRSKRSAW